MSPRRVAVAAAVAIALGGVVVWQYSRERQVSACVAEGGAWNGALSRCEAKRPILLERDGLKRG